MLSHFDLNQYMLILHETIIRFVSENGYPSYVCQWIFFHIIVSLWRFIITSFLWSDCIWQYPITIYHMQKQWPDFRLHLICIEQLCWLLWPNIWLYLIFIWLMMRHLLLLLTSLYFCRTKYHRSYHFDILSTCR